jgi:hypothetical protein
VPEPLQFASLTQVQAAAPTAPVQAWCVPHEAAAAQAVQPFEPVTQVWMPPPPHCFWPAVQAFVQGTSAASPPSFASATPPSLPAAPVPAAPSAVEPAAPSAPAPPPS